MPATEQTARDQKRLHRIFAISSLVLLASTIWMFAKDHDRQWKSYQDVGRRIDVAYAEWDKVRALAEQSKSDLEDLEAALLIAQTARPDEDLIASFKKQVAKDYAVRNHTGEEPLGEDDIQAAFDASEVSAIHARIDAAYNKIPAQQDASSNEGQAEEAKAQVAELVSVLASVIAQARFREDNVTDSRKMKAAEFDAAKSQVDLAVRDNKPLEGPQAEVQRVEAELDTLTRQMQHAADHRQVLQKNLDEITAGQRNTQKEIDDIKGEIVQLAESVGERQSTWFMSEFPFLGKKWLEAPILSAFNSPHKIENLWTEGLTHDMYNFKPVLRYDRCTTCHQSIEKTQPGSAVDPLFPHVHEVSFSLDTPTPAELDELLNTGEGAESEGGASAGGQPTRLTLHDVYGFMLADEGLLSRDDVTINYVGVETRAARTRMLPDEAGVRYVTQKEIQRTLSSVLPGADDPAPLHGLMVGDVILEINGSLVLSLEEVRRMLLSSLTWGRPVQLKIRRGYPHPYVTHPRLDLFVGSTSPHQMQTFGCTVCHEGQGSATEFKWVSHTPNTLKERNLWRKQYGWFDNHHWIYPMFPERFEESSCLKCHHDVVELEPSERFPEPPAPQLMAGYNTFRQYGCFGCHEVVGFDGPDKRVGPDLRLEPNYFAAGLQLAHFAAERQSQLKEQITAASGEEQEALQTKLDTIEPVLKDVQKWGAMLGKETFNDTARHRLKELVDLDQDDFDRYNTALAAGDVAKAGAYVPVFPDGQAAHDTALVLQDEEMPGQFRKVGPSLRFVASKLNAPFMDDWIREPKHFRPSSRMPQFFDLHKHFADHKEEVAHTTALEETEVQGIREYLLNYSQPFDPLESGTMLPAPAADAELQVQRGKTLFEVGGCLACHSNEDFPGHGDQGPDLTGLASKLVGEKGRKWLYGWIENPKRYHARTKMPVVPLKRLPEAYEEMYVGTTPDDTDPIADVVEYLLSEKKAGWAPVNPPVDSQVVNELALMHLAKTFSTSYAEEYLETGIPASRRSTLKGAEVELLVADELVTDGAPLSEKQKLLYIGSKTISKYGCFACHDIPGFETAKPIGTALSDWGRKDTTTLAFEHIDHYVGHGHGGSGHGDGHHNRQNHGKINEGEGEGAANHGPSESMHEPTSHAEAADVQYYEAELHHHSRAGFIYQKLKEPRSYDYKKIENKPYNDRLRMPQFPLDHQQREQVITFVLGLVASPPAEQFVFSPSPRQQAINEGRKVLDRFNCGGCHELEREEWEISFPEDWIELPAPNLTRTFPFLFPHISEEELLNSQQTSRSGRLHAALRGRVLRTENGGVDVQRKIVEEGEIFYEAARADVLPVDELAFKFQLYEPTVMAGKLYMPYNADPLVPVQNLDKRYPAHGGDLAAYLLPRVLAMNGQVNKTKGKEAWGWVPPTLVGEGKKVQPEWLHSFLLEPYPIRPAVMLNMPKFNISPDEATRLVNYFAAKDNAEYPYQFQQTMSPSHLKKLAEQYAQEVAALPADQRGAKVTGDRFADAMNIVTEKTTGCVKCHSVADYVNTNDPRAQGPNLARVHERLRPQYVRNWVAYPYYTLPYTSMLVAFNYNPDNPAQDGFPVKGLYHGDSTQQLDAVVDILMNFDKYAEDKTSIADMVPKDPPTPEGADPAAAPEGGNADPQKPTTGGAGGEIPAETTP